MEEKAIRNSGGYLTSTNHFAVCLIQTSVRNRDLILETGKKICTELCWCFHFMLNHLVTHPALLKPQSHSSHSTQPAYIMSFFQRRTKFPGAFTHTCEYLYHTHRFKIHICNLFCNNKILLVFFFKHTHFFQLVQGRKLSWALQNLNTQIGQKKMSCHMWLFALFY